jgi:hypothetical protein
MSTEAGAGARLQPRLFHGRYLGAGIGLPLFHGRCLDAGIGLPLFHGRCPDAGIGLPLFHGRCPDAGIGLPLPLVSPAAERVTAPGGSSFTSLQRQPDARVDSTTVHGREVFGRSKVRAKVHAWSKRQSVAWFRRWYCACADRGDGIPCAAK